MKNKYYLLDENIYKGKYTTETSGISPFNAGIPLIETDDKTIEEIYYYRWHSYCQQIKETPAGFVVTEFLPEVPWAGIYNTINCPAGHHFYEGRWLHDRRYMSDYARFWFTPEADPRKYSFWAADSIYTVCETWGDHTLSESLYEELKKNYAEWEKSHGRECGLFYQVDGRDGMEFSISGHGLRPTINSYMYADAVALSKIAKRLGKKDDEKLYSEKAQKLRSLINTRLWDEKAEFYKNLSEQSGYRLADVREEIGYVPWCFGIPEERMSVAWKYLNDEKHFAAPYGPTTAEKCHPDFMKEFDHECLWNGPSWPFATSQTLTAMANLIKDYNQSVINALDYYKLLHKYASCHYIVENGKKRPFIDENLDPFTGEWLARKILHSIVPERPDKDRGHDYNHSTFCDLVISGLAGIRVCHGKLIISPLFSDNDLSCFCADGIKIKNSFISVSFDRCGKHFEKGLNLYINGKKIASSEDISTFTIKLSEVD